VWCNKSIWFCEYFFASPKSIRGFPWQGLTTSQVEVPRSDLLPHNAHFRDIGCRFRHPLTLFLTPLAPRRARDHEPQPLGAHSRLPRNLLSSHPPPSPAYPLSPLLQAQNIASPKMASYDLRAGSAKHGCLCSIITWTSSTTNMARFLLPASLFLAVARQSCTHLLPQPSFHFLCPIKDRLPPSRLWYRFQIVPRLYIAVLTYAGGLPSP
jgi:hypothetical protein